MPLDHLSSRTKVLVCTTCSGSGRKPKAQGPEGACPDCRGEGHFPKTLFSLTPLTKLEAAKLLRSVSLDYLYELPTKGHSHAHRG